jgi:hypothetical protein
MAASGSGWGGISAVNPQAKGSYQDYIDASFKNAKARLDPIFKDQRSAYEQNMVNRGIPVGGEAYNSSFQQLDQNQNDAYSNAAFNAMGFGLGAQAQDFGQDLSRSNLANAMLRSKWSDDTARYGIDTNAATAANALGEQGRQFDLGLGQRGYEFDSNLDQRNYEFDTNTDYNYWDRGTQFDMMDRSFFEDQGRYADAQNQQDYQNQLAREQWQYAALMNAFMGLQAPSPYYQDPTSAYSSQLNAYNTQRGQNYDLMGQLMGTASTFGGG